MKKRAVGVILLALMISVMIGCKQIQEAVKAKAPDVNKAFTSAVEIEYNDTEVKGIVTRYGSGMWDMEITDPETLAGLNISYGNNGVTAELGELSFDIPLENVNSNAIFAALFNAIDNAAGTTEMDYAQTENGVTYTGTNSNGSYILTFDPETFMLTDVEIPDLDIKVTVLSVSELSTNIHPVEETEVTTTAVE